MRGVGGLSDFRLVHEHHQTLDYVDSKVSNESRDHHHNDCSLKSMTNEKNSLKLLNAYDYDSEQSNKAKVAL